MAVKITRRRRRPRSPRNKGDRHGRNDGAVPGECGTTSGYLATPPPGKGPGARDSRSGGACRPHQEGVRPLRRRRLLALAPDLTTARRRPSRTPPASSSWPSHRPGGEGPARGVDVSGGHSSTAKLGVVGFCMERPARAVRGDAQPERRRDGELLRHPSQTSKPDYSKLAGPCSAVRDKEGS